MGPTRFKREEIPFEPHRRWQIFMRKCFNVGRLRGVLNAEGAGAELVRKWVKSSGLKPHRLPAIHTLPCTFSQRAAKSSMNHSSASSPGWTKKKVSLMAPLYRAHLSASMKISVIIQFRNKSSHFLLVLVMESIKFFHFKYRLYSPENNAQCFKNKLRKFFNRTQPAIQSK